jgi:lipopolysaccharide transport system permease protein
MTKAKIITSEPLTIREYYKEVIKFRSLIWVFAYQELKAMYAQTFFGIFWAVIRPLITLFIFTIIFKFFLHVPTQSPYYLFAFAGMIAWNLFANISNNASSAILQKQSLIRKMYFPKLILPLSKIILACVEAGISLVILFILLFVERVNLTIGLFTLPIFIILNIACGYTVAIWMNATNIRFRDLNQIIPTIIGIGIWITPVFYPTTIIPKGFELFVYINPLAGVIKGYRFALLGEPFPELSYWYIIPVMLVVMLAGTWYFSRVEDSTVDYA